MSSLRQPAETAPAAAPGLEPLAVLPVFLKLHGKRTVLAGGSAGAVWKARLVAAAGARVDVYASTMSDEMRAAGGASILGRIALHARSWETGDLDGAALAIAAQDEEEDAARFVAAARARGIIVNAVDRPHLCDVQFGAVVNRSPLVVGISTDGAAPVLGQAVRSAIEALLPAGFAAWTEAAKGWRERVKWRFATISERRRFWERFADAAFRQPDRILDDAAFANLAAGIAARGSVALVGAGPGDPEFLTLKAVRALRGADVILYDHSVAPAILHFARREAKTMLLNQGGHDRSCRQVAALIVRLAGHEGRRVVRLMGGDPLIGHAETLEACRRASIAVEIVPGIL